MDIVILADFCGRFDGTDNSRFLYLANMYVYVSDKWNIILKTMNRKIGIQNRYREYITNYTMEDNLIFEWWQVIKYENSKQYLEDIEEYKLIRENKKLKKENEKLKPIAEREVRNQLRKRSYEKLTEFDYKKYENYFNNK